MPHVDEGTLHALLDGELGAAEVLEVQTHFATCAACAARLDEARQMLAETERLVAALEPPAGGGAARAPRLVVGRPMIPLDPVVLIPHNPTPTEVRRSRFKIMAWAASFLVIVGAGFLGLEMRNSLPGNRKPGSLRIRPEEFTFSNDRTADSGGSGPGASKPAPAAAADSLSQSRAPSPQALAEKAPSAPAPSATPSAGAAPGKGAANQVAPAQPKSPATPAKTDVSPSVAKVGTPVAELAAGAAAGKAAGGSPTGRTAPAAANAQRAAPAPAAASVKDTAAPQQSREELKATDDQAAQRSQGQSADDRLESVDRAMSDKATADLDREQMRQRAAAATAALDREREDERAAAAEATRRQEAAAAESSPPTVDQKANVSRRIGLDEAARQLGGPLHAIDGMTRQLVGLVSPQLVPGADSTRAVVRAVYVDRNGRTLYLDQQRVRPGQLDLPFTPQVGPNGQLSWMAGSVLLVLQSDLPQDSLRALARRVR
jgi:Putative zinc-finger